MPSKKPFDRIIVVMFENQYRSYVMQDPFMKKLASAGCNMTNYFGAFHPSQTNYIASIAGEICSVTNDTPPASPLQQQNIVDLLEAGGVSWKAYMEGYPGDPWNSAWTSPDYDKNLQPLNEYPDTAPDLARYFRKHNPFASFHTIQASKERWNRIVGDNAFWTDVQGETLPEYSWFTPDIWNDGHYLYNTHVDTNPRTLLVPQLSAWLQYVFLGDIAAKKVQGSTLPNNLGLNLDIDLVLTDPQAAYAASNIPAGALVVVTFDEADYDAVGYDTNYDGPNQIYTVLLGDMIEPGSNEATPFNHYNLIRTVEENYGLGSLGKNDKGANWFQFLWGKQFQWAAPKPVGLNVSVNANGRAALATLGSDTWLVFADQGNALQSCRHSAGAWSAPEATGLTASGPIGLAAIGDRLELVYVDGSSGDIYSARMNGGVWSEATALDQRTGGDVAILRYHDYADEVDKLMLVWQSPQDDYMKWLNGDAGGWNKTEKNVGQLTDGGIALAQLGAAVFVVYKERRSWGMRVCAFNTARFNSFKAQTFKGQPAPDNDTSLHEWSVQDFPVGHFAKKFAAQQNDYLANGQLAMATANGEMRLLHRAPYDDTPQVNTETFGLTGIYAAASTATNGFGTLDQAGWTEERELAGVTVDSNGALAICNAGDRLVYVFQEQGGNALQFGVGEYGPK
jgi:hypothetical protein